MEIRIIKDAISRVELMDLSKQQFGEMVKAGRGCRAGNYGNQWRTAVGEEAVLLERGSTQRNLWGINLYRQSYS